MSGKRVRRTRRTGLNFIVTVVAAVAVIGLLGWWVTRLATDDDDGVLPTAGAGGEPSGDGSGDTSDSASGSPSGSASGSPSDSPSGSASDSPSGDASAAGDSDDVEAALDACVDQLRPVEAAVKAARPGVASWHAHVQARTDWLSGRISAERMDALFTRTKHAGHRAEPRFTEAVAAVDRPRPCTGLKDVTASGDRVAHCKARSAAAAAALTAAERAMREWGEHLKHMAKYANGGMSSGKAMKLWVAAWRRGPGEVAAYQRSVHALHRAPACGAA